MPTNQCLGNSYIDISECYAINSGDIAMISPKAGLEPTGVGTAAPTS